MAKKLLALLPHYLAQEGRYGMGLSLFCPNQTPEHLEARGPHRIELWFAKPDDGYLPNFDAAPLLFEHFGGVLDEGFTLYSKNVWPEYLVTIPGHWSGYIVEGVVYDAPIMPA